MKLIRIFIFHCSLITFACVGATSSNHSPRQVAGIPPSFISSSFGHRPQNAIDLSESTKLCSASAAGTGPLAAHSDLTIQQLREELKRRLLNAADDFMSMKANADKLALRAQEIADREQKEKWFVVRLLSKIIRKITKTKESKADVNRIGILSKEAFSQMNLDVGVAGEKVIAVAEELAQLNPTAVPLMGFKGQYGASPTESKLAGLWKLRFTTAADASFSESKERGVVSTSQEIDAERGTLTNIIDFEKGNLKGFRVVVQGEPFGPDILDLSFKKVQILRKSRFPRLFGQFTIWLPTRLIKFLASRNGNKRGPYLQLKYLDDNLRMHKTDRGNWFIQSRLD